MDNLSSQSEIVELKNKCIQYEKKSIEELKKSKNEIVALEAKIQQIKTKNLELASEIDALGNEYKDLLQKSASNAKEDAIAEEKFKLGELKQKHENLLNQSSTLKQKCDLMNDTGYLNSLVMYWTPQAMFKYTQAYNMQSKA